MVMMMMMMMDVIGKSIGGVKNMAYVMRVDEGRTRVFRWVVRLRELNNTLTPHAHVCDNILL